MKAERRHELQQNSLAKFLDNFPIMVRLYADRILLVVVLVLLVIVLIRWRVNAAAERTSQVANDLATARGAVRKLQNIRMVGPGDRLAAERSQSMDEVNAAISSIAENAGRSDASLQAQALVTRGDLYWTLANLPPIPGAATQPSLQLPSSSEEYLNKAAEAYQQVLKTYPDQKEAALSANFALAAIAENRHNWDEASAIYERIKNSDADKMYKDLAAERLKLLPELKEPILLGTLTTKPAPLAPLVMAPTTQATSQPASAPS